MEPPKLGKARKSRDCDITAELDSCKKMMAYLASEDGDGHDVQLILKDGTEIPAHSFILRLRSEKLRTKVDEAKAEGKNSKAFVWVFLTVYPYPNLSDPHLTETRFFRMLLWVPTNC